ncbi:hypothetical protein GCM10007147_33200 [Nocardiopsis kunsanensis]|uniref:Uncharacterized protein n=1 Tax=Nocardiopsis kunsanensis TaxID=141693 RepID=A0A919CKG1_9ACTN|nr:hypothetical protein GCM10007147_33200 [Nocardiopsis kunsanensis]
MAPSAGRTCSHEAEGALRTTSSTTLATRAVVHRAGRGTARVTVVTTASREGPGLSRLDATGPGGTCRRAAEHKGNARPLRNHLPLRPRTGGLCTGPRRAQAFVQEYRAVPGHL